MSIQLKSQSDYDRNIILVASGGLAATIGFLDKFPAATPMWLVFTSWIFWALSLIAVIGSHAASVNSLNKTRDELDEFMERILIDVFSPSKSRWDTVLFICNHASFWLLTLGIFFCGAALGIGILSPVDKKYEQRQTIERAEGTPSSTAPTETESIEELWRGIQNNGRSSYSSPTTASKAEKIVTSEEKVSPSASEKPHPPVSEPAEPPSQ